MPPKIGAAAAASSQKLFQPGDRVYVQTYDESWTLGHVTSVEDVQNPSTGKKSFKYHCSVDSNKELSIEGMSNLIVTEDKVHQVVPEDTDSADLQDLLLMTYLHDSTLLQAVRQRYFKDIIYTLIGPIVLAINPFNYNIARYTDDMMPKYLEEGHTIERNMPHSWAVAHNTYFEMRNWDQNQSIIVSGESGAGKTEAAKIVAKYLGRISHKSAPPGTEISPVPVKVNESSPILEAFGNAKTKRNDNSSRFGKLMKIHFSRSLGTMTGAEIEVYLLEKSRVVFHSEGERAYHAFYQAAAKDFAAAGNPEHNDSFAASFSGSFDPHKVPGADEDMFLHEVIKVPVRIEGVNDLEEYEGVCKAMCIVGLAPEDQKDAWRVCAGVLHALHITFRKSEDGEGSDIDRAASGRTLERAAFLWGVPKDELEKELLTTTNIVAGDMVLRQHTTDKARDVRDALCKALYEKLFLELVDLVNISVGAPKNPENWIGLLDIFGFEHFVRNSLEQLCINLANETLQGHYNQIIFKRDMEECLEEGINTTSVVFQDNQATLDMIRGKVSLLSLLDQECALGKGKDITFASSVTQEFKSHPSFIHMKTDPMLFGVRHYAGDVSYSVDGFREKNMDTLKDAFKLMINRSERKFVSKLLAVEDEKVKKAKTVGQVFTRQLDGLMAVLNSTHPHWIRCVKPHPQKKPRMFNGTEVMSQLCCAGVLETVRIRKMSFSVRFLFSDFWRHYRIVVGGRLAVPDQRAACNRILLDKFGFDHSLAQAGKTKVFLKSDAFQKVSREKDRLRIAAKNHVVAYLRGLNAVKNVAARTHLKFVRHIQAHARLRITFFALRDVRYELDKRATVAMLIRMRQCETDEVAARRALRKAEAASLAEAEEGAKDLLLLLFRLMCKQKVGAITDSEERQRRAISSEYWVMFSQFENSHIVLRAELEGRTTILREMQQRHAAHESQRVVLRKQYLDHLRSVLDRKVGEVFVLEDEARQTIALHQNGDAIFLFASVRIMLQEKQARRALYMRARGFNRDILQVAAQERVQLMRHYENVLRGRIAEEEQQLRIVYMLDSDRDHAAVERLLLAQKKEMYLQQLEKIGAARRKFVLPSNRR